MTITTASKKNSPQQESSKIAQAHNCLRREQCILLLCKLIKKGALEACFWIRTNTQGDFAISQYLLG